MEQGKKGIMESWEVGINLKELTREEQKIVLGSASDCMLLSEIARRLLSSNRKLKAIEEVFIEK